MKRWLPFTAALLLCACGGGGGGGSVPSAPNPTATGPGTVQLHIVFPSTGPTAKMRHPLYASAGSQTIAITINGKPLENNQITQTCGSNASSFFCTFNFPAPPGNDTFVVALGDANFNPLSKGTTTAAVSSGQTTQLHMILNGVPAYALLQVDNPNPAVGTASTVHLSATVYDSSGNQIIGDDYLTPITVASDDTSGQVTMSSTQLTNPSSTINVNYTGRLAGLVTFHVTSPVAPQNQTAVVQPDPYTVFGPTTYPVTDLVSANDGTLWFSECTGLSPCKIGKMTTSGAITEFADIPHVKHLAVGPDGNIWFSEDTNPYAGVITPSGQISEYLVKTLGSYEAYNAGPIVTGPDGNLWICDSYRIFKMTSSGAVTTYQLGGAFWPASIVNGPDGALWFGEGGQIGRIATDGTITQYLIPASSYGSMNNNIVFGPDHNLYFLYNGLERITTGGTISQISTTPSNVNFGGPLSFGPDGNLWGTGSIYDPYATIPMNGIARVTTGGTLSLYPYSPAVRNATPSSGGGGSASVWGADGNLWFIDVNHIIRMKYAP